MRFVVCVAAFVAACGVACGAAVPVPPPGRALCYAVADQRAQARVDAECRIGAASVPFSQCPAHDEILAALRAELKECK